MVLLGCGGIGLALAGCQKAPPPAQAQQATEQKATESKPAGKLDQADAGALPEPVQKFVGRWVRADGGYILEVFGGDRSGVLKAGYFNPKPINVSRAIWMQGGGGHQIIVELNDVGYPGATYILSHDAKTDRLVGQYNQPAMQQSFDIEFIRQAKQ